MDLLTEFKALIQLLNKNNIEYALCGGLALAVYAKPRATLDIDLMIKPEVLEKIKKIVAKLGFIFPAAPMFFKTVQIHRLTKIDEYSGEHLILDLLLVTPTTEISWNTRILAEWQGEKLKVLSPSGLIALKLLRNNGQDQEDIQYLQGLIDED